MKSLEQNIQGTDSKYEFPLSLHRKSQVFKRLKNYFLQEREKQKQIKLIRMEGVLKRLAYSSYLNYKKNSEINKTN